MKEMLIVTTGRLRKIFLIVSTGLYIALCQQYAAETAELAGSKDCFVANLLIRGDLIIQKRVNNQHECIGLCKQYKNCGAVTMNNQNHVCYVYASVYSTMSGNDRYYRTAERKCFDQAPSQDTGNLFQLVDSSGHFITGQQNGLLLYNGGTLCGSNFNITAAQAVCKLMGFKKALSWKSGHIWRTQDRYKVSSHGLACSLGDWSSCVFRSDGKVCNDHTQDVFLTCSGKRSPFTLVNFSGSQVSGLQQFLLLYNGGTVCGDHFSDNSAHAICKDMGYFGAKMWRIEETNWSLGNSKVDYHIALDDVSCTKPDWKSCYYSTSHDCAHGKVIHLSCMVMQDYNNVAADIDNGKTYLTLICIVLAVIIWGNKSKINDINKKNAENNAKTGALVKNLQDQLEELKNVREKFPKPNIIDSSGDEYHDVCGPDLTVDVLNIACNDVG